MVQVHVQVKLLKGRRPLLFAWWNKVEGMVNACLVSCPCQDLELQDCVAQKRYSGQRNMVLNDERFDRALQSSEVISIIDEECAPDFSLVAALKQYRAIKAAKKKMVLAIARHEKVAAAKRKTNASKKKASRKKKRMAIRREKKSMDSSKCQIGDDRNNAVELVQDATSSTEDMEMQEKLSEFLNKSITSPCGPIPDEPESSNWSSDDFTTPPILADLNTGARIHQERARDTRIVDASHDCTAVPLPVMTDLPEGCQSGAKVIPSLLSGILGGTDSSSWLQIPGAVAGVAVAMDVVSGRDKSTAGSKVIHRASGVQGDNGAAVTKTSSSDGSSLMGLYGPATGSGVGLSGDTARETTQPIVGTSGGTESVDRQETIRPSTTTGTEWAIKDPSERTADRTMGNIGKESKTEGASHAVDGPIEGTRDGSHVSQIATRAQIPGSKLSNRAPNVTVRPTAHNTMASDNTESKTKGTSQAAEGQTRGARNAEVKIATTPLMPGSALSQLSNLYTYAITPPTSVISDIRTRLDISREKTLHQKTMFTVDRSGAMATPKNVGKTHTPMVIRGTPKGTTVNNVGKTHTPMVIRGTPKGTTGAARPPIPGLIPDAPSSGLSNRTTIAAPTTMHAADRPEDNVKEENKSSEVIVGGTPRGTNDRQKDIKPEIPATLLLKLSNGTVLKVPSAILKSTFPTRSLGGTTGQGGQGTVRSNLQSKCSLKLSNGTTVLLPTHLLAGNRTIARDTSEGSLQFSSNLAQNISTSETHDDSSNLNTDLATSSTVEDQTHRNKRKRKATAKCGNSSAGANGPKKVRIESPPTDGYTSLETSGVASDLAPFPSTANDEEGTKPQVKPRTKKVTGAPPNDPNHKKQSKIQAKAKNVSGALPNRKTAANLLLKLSNGAVLRVPLAMPKSKFRDAALEGTTNWGDQVTVTSNSQGKGTTCSMNLSNDNTLSIPSVFFANNRTISNDTSEGSLPVSSNSAKDISTGENHDDSNSQNTEPTSSTVEDQNRRSKRERKRTATFVNSARAKVTKKKTVGSPSTDVSDTPLKTMGAAAHHAPSPSTANGKKRTKPRAKAKTRKVTGAPLDRKKQTKIQTEAKTKKKAVSALTVGDKTTVKKRSSLRGPSLPKDVSAEEASAKCGGDDKPVRKVTPQNTPTVCEHCGKSVTIRHLPEHIEAFHHEGVRERRYKCHLCDAGYFQAGHLREHIRVVHEQFRYKCRFCNKGMTDDFRRKLHENSHFPKDKPIFPFKKKQYPIKNREKYRNQTTVCEECGLTVRKYEMRKHRADHNKPYPCYLCGRFYNQWGRYGQHMNKHHPERPLIPKIVDPSQPNDASLTVPDSGPSPVTMLPATAADDAHQPCNDTESRTEIALDEPPTEQNTTNKKTKSKKKKDKDRGKHKRTKKQKKSQDSISDHEASEWEVEWLDALTLAKELAEATEPVDAVQTPDWVDEPTLTLSMEQAHPARQDEILQAAESDKVDQSLESLDSYPV